MITVGDVTSALQVPANKLGMVKILVGMINDQLEQYTNRLWAWRQGYYSRFEVSDATAVRLWTALYPIAEVIGVYEWTPQELPALGLFLPFGVTEDNPAQTEAAATLADPTDYDVNKQTGKITRTRFDPWNQRVKVYYSGGYAADPNAAPVTLSDSSSYTIPQVPASVKYACLVQLEFLLSRNSSEKIAATSQGFKGGSAQLMQADIHPTFQATIDQFRSDVPRY